MKLFQLIVIVCSFGLQVEPMTLYHYFSSVGGYYPVSYDFFFQNLGHTKKTKTKTQHRHRHRHRYRGNAGRNTVPMFANGQQKFTSLKSICLYAHNKVRGIHGVPGVTWDEGLASSAKQWARNVADRGYLYHSPGCLAGKYGENLAYRSLNFKGIWSPAYLIFNLYSELWDPGYNFNYPDSNRGTGHFTQMVWKGTKKIGCAIATKMFNRAGKMTYLVCQYYPKGNTVGQFEWNVPRPMSGRSLPSSGKSLAVEGCSDYSAYCKNMKKSCSYMREVREACCDSCRWSFNG